MAERRPKPIGIVIFSPPATQDYVDIYNSTTFAWGQEQAERYADLLDEAVAKLAENSKWGKVIEGYTHARSYFVKWKRAKHGHYIIYRVMEKGIYVIRILHGAMDIPRHIGRD